MSPLAKTPPQSEALSGRPLAMSSREIAELTGKEHKNVLADVRRMLSELGMASAEFSADLPDGYGRLQPGFNLPKDLTITLVSGYSVVMRHRIVVRWQELEAANAGAIAVPQTLPEALRLAADLAEGKARAERQLALAAPKVEYADALLNSEATVLVGDVAKTLGVGVRKLFAALRAKGILLAGGAPAAEYVQKGYLVETQAPYKDAKDVDRIRPGARVTTRGIEFCRRFIGRHPELFGPVSPRPAQVEGRPYDTVGLVDLDAFKTAGLCTREASERMLAAHRRGESLELATERRPA